MSHYFEILAILEHQFECFERLQSSPMLYREMRKAKKERRRAERKEEKEKEEKNVRTREIDEADDSEGKKSKKRKLSEDMSALSTLVLDSGGVRISVSELDQVIPA
jgi:hypothetical protein